MGEVITISGKAGHGKDSAAIAIKAVLEMADKKVMIMHFADCLKFICRKYFGWNGEKDNNGRTLLQYIGTDRIRALYPDFWIEIIRKLIIVFGSDYDYFLLPDARFPNEIDNMKNANLSVTALNVVKTSGKSILSHKQQEHESEKALDSYKFDYEITADDIAELEEKSVLFALNILKRQ